MKAFVTGGRGFIGSFLVAALLERGFQVDCLLRTGTAGWLEGLNFRRVNGDLMDVPMLQDAVRGCTHVFHLAGLTKALDPQDFYRVNTDGTRNLIRAVTEYCPDLEKFVFVSSLAGAGPSPPQKPNDETAPPKPVSHYGRSKARAEEIVQAELGNIPFTTIRPPAVFGPRDKDAFELFKQANLGICLELSGGPRFGSLVYVHDLVDAIVLSSLTEKTNGQVYYVCYPEPFDWVEITQRIAKIIGKRARKVKLPLLGGQVAALGAELYRRIFRNATYLSLDKFEEIKQTHWTCDPSKAMSDFGFSPSQSLDNALRETYHWYLKRGWL